MDGRPFYSFLIFYIKCIEGICVIYRKLVMGRVMEEEDDGDLVESMEKVELGKYK
jgi:hypothetical protein